MHRTKTMPPDPANQDAGEEPSDDPGAASATSTCSADIHERDDHKDGKNRPRAMV
jgi:hypothetical protein